MQRRATRARLSQLLCAVLALLVAPALSAKIPYYNHWKALYPDSKTDDNIIAGIGAGCQVCHVSSDGGNPWNDYGWQVRTAFISGMSIDDAILSAEPFNSDNDPTGSTNLEEILSDSQPGWTYGPNNTWHDASGSVMTGKLPPATIQGFLNPVWTKLLDATLIGSFGPPDLKGVGSLTASMPMALNLGSANPSSAALLFVGLSELSAPFKGGTLVPAVDLLVPLATSAAGGASLQATWPAGIPPGFHFWVQVWITDPGGPVGFAASNGLKGTAN